MKGGVTVVVVPVVLRQWSSDKQRFVFINSEFIIKVVWPRRFVRANQGIGGSCVVCISDVGTMLLVGT